MKDDTLQTYQQALEDARAQGDRDAEAVALNNIATVYHTRGEARQAISYYTQALEIVRTEGDHTAIASLLNNISTVHYHMEETERAIELQREIIVLMQRRGTPADEAMFHYNIGVMYQNMQEFDEAIAAVETGRDLLVANGLEQNAAGGTVAYYDELIQRLRYEKEHPEEAGQQDQTMDMLQQMLAMGGEQAVREMLQEQGVDENQINQLIQAAQGGAPPAASQTLPPELMETITMGVIQVMHAEPAARDELRGVIVNMREEAQGNGPDWQIETEFFSALLDILDDKPIELPAGHAYAEALQTIKRGIANPEAHLHAHGNGQQVMSDEQLEPLLQATMAVMTVYEDKKDELRADITRFRDDALTKGKEWQVEVDLFNALLALLNGDDPGLAADHPYAHALQQVQMGIEAAENGAITLTQEMLEGPDWEEQVTQSLRDQGVDEEQIATIIEQLRERREQDNPDA